MQQQAITPLEVKEINLATKEQMAGGFLAFLIPLMLLMSVASGGMPAATDLVAGEKKRGTSGGLTYHSCWDSFCAHREINRCLCHGLY